VFNWFWDHLEPLGERENGSWKIGRWASNKCLAMKIYGMDEKLSINMFMDEMLSQQWSQSFECKFPYKWILLCLNWNDM
jgi:hypothetical protein